MRRTVRHQLGWQLRQFLGYVVEMGDADRGDDVVRPQNLPVIQVQDEAVAGLVQGHDLTLFDIADESPLEVKGVRDEDVQADRKIGVVVRDTPFGAVRRERCVAVRRG